VVNARGRIPNATAQNYLQQVKDVLAGVGIHVEPGFWVTVPQTTNPAEAATVARMASIPHGTTVNAQGTATTVDGGPIITPVSIRPFPIGGPPPANTAVAFPPFNEADLSVPTTFRLPNPIPASITQTMVNNPNSVLTAAVAAAGFRGARLRGPFGRLRRRLHRRPWAIRRTVRKTNTGSIVRDKPLKIRGRSRVAGGGGGCHGCDGERTDWSVNCRIPASRGGKQIIPSWFPNDLGTSHTRKIVERGDGGRTDTSEIEIDSAVASGPAMNQAYQVWSASP
jgi:hypothetical protein